MTRFVKALLSRILAHSFLLLLSMLFLLPLLWLLTASFVDQPELLTSGISLSSISVTLEYYGEAVTRMAYFKLLANTSGMAILAAFGAMLSCTLAGYSLSKLRWRGRSFLLAATAAVLFIPGQVTMIPEFILMSKLGLTGSLAPLIIKPTLGVPLYILLLRQFMVSLPDELLQLARIDGAGEVRMLGAIILPLSLPVIMLVGLFQFIASWQDFLGPLLYVSDPSRYTLSLGLQQFQSELGTEWGELTAASALAALPLLLLFAAMQTRMLGGFTSIERKP